MKRNMKRNTKIGILLTVLLVVSEVAGQIIIGKPIVGILFMFLFIIMLSVLSVGLALIWVSGLTLVSNFIWRNYDPLNGEEPRKIWRKISAFLIMLRDRDFSKREDVWKEIESDR